MSTCRCGQTHGALLINLAGWVGVAGCDSRLKQGHTEPHGLSFRRGGHANLLELIDTRVCWCTARIPIHLALPARWKVLKKPYV